MADASGPPPPPPDCSALLDGAPCDDQNICTDASSCQSGACVPGVPKSSCTVADSQNEFAQTQGVKGWWYGNWRAAGDSSYDPSSEFEPAVFDGLTWVPPDAATNPTWSYTAWWGGHPDATPMLLPIRRWVSDVRGPAVIEVAAFKGDTGCGDGVRAQLLLDGVTMWMRDIAFDDNVEARVAVPVELDLGSIVEFMLLPRSEDGCDTTDHYFTIRSP